MYQVICKSITKQHQANVNKYIKLDLQYQSANDEQDLHDIDSRSLSKVERRMEVLWERQADVAANLPKREVARADRALFKVRGY
jgi:hypothetical protein